MRPSACGASLCVGPVQTGSAPVRVAGSRAPTLRGGGARVVGSFWCLSDGRGAWPRRGLHPVMSRFHDERCLSGSGWGKALALARKGEPWSAPAAKARWLLARETSAGGCHRSERRLRSPLAKRNVIACPRELARRVNRRGSATRTVSFLESEIKTGLGRSCGCARGLCWLQKSSSGARSKPKGDGSSSPAPARGSSKGESAP
jgi:hypothetical protein